MTDHHKQLNHHHHWTIIFITVVVGAVNEVYRKWYITTEETTALANLLRILTKQNTRRKVGYYTNAKVIKAVEQTMAPISWLKIKDDADRKI